LDQVAASSPIHSLTVLVLDKVDQDFKIHGRQAPIGVQDLFQIHNSLHHLVFMEVILAMQIA
jgi:hypothetical protein